MPFSPIISVCAGAASAILFISAVGGSLIGVTLSLFFAPLPIAIAGFGWGWMTALGAAATAAIGLALIANAVAVIMYAIAIALPMVAFTYLLTLRRDLTADDGSVWVQWYPVGSVLAALSIWSGLLATAAVVAIGGDIESISAALRPTIDRFFEAQTQLSNDLPRTLTPEEKDRLAQVIARMTPGATAAVWMLVGMFGLWLGAGVTARSGRLQRPWFDFTTIVVPRPFPLLFAIAAGLTFVSGPVGLIASGFAWAFFLVYMLVGLAIIHQLTRGQSLRVVALIAVYFALLFLNPLSGIALAMVGLAEPVWPMRRQLLEDQPQPRGPSPPGQGPGPTNTT